MSEHCHGTPTKYQCHSERFTITEVLVLLKCSTVDSMKHPSYLDVSTVVYIVMDERFVDRINCAWNRTFARPFFSLYRGQNRIAVIAKDVKERIMKMKADAVQPKRPPQTLFVRLPPELRVRIFQCLVEHEPTEWALLPPTPVGTFRNEVWKAEWGHCRNMVKRFATYRRWLWLYHDENPEILEEFDDVVHNRFTYVIDFSWCRYKSASWILPYVLAVFKVNHAFAYARRIRLLRVPTALVTLEDIHRPFLFNAFGLQTNMTLELSRERTIVALAIDQMPIHLTQVVPANYFLPEDLSPYTFDRKALLRRLREAQSHFTGCFLGALLQTDAGVSIGENDHVLNEKAIIRSLLSVQHFAYTQFKLWGKRDSGPIEIGFEEILVEQICTYCAANPDKGKCYGISVPTDDSFTPCAAIFPRACFLCAPL
ncbi:hypothetical protein EJ05DRAFT_352168 [Pseudovirgaria hyperparasitica]|uniref:Uncharacterized protein n=1 Tax=Pseudovirgaria hyperparasitica TaxID=470096 RepID=A0A6A6W769_9PEZI|nr:uncharacterized protein EJ05DRAFT_352168 [Pseudovirgaria hyperparasitica]KAF2758473.1 hypothetical protein EJ05DRAFT_352168 [Pseudovirgaria hyperparasitica]